MKAIKQGDKRCVTDVSCDTSVVMSATSEPCATATPAAILSLFPC